MAGLPITSTYATARTVAIEAVISASQICSDVFEKLVNKETVTKKDNSPVTVADFTAQAVVNTILSKNFPNDPIVGEEDSKDLRGEDETATLLRKRIVELSSAVLNKSEATEEKLLKAIDLGCHTGGPKGRFWTLDPIDGTKGFLRGGQYAVCLALIVDGVVQLGVMGCPNLPVGGMNVDAEGKPKSSGERGCLFVAEKGVGAFQCHLPSAVAFTPQSLSFSSINVQSLPLQSTSFLESYESGHSSHSASASIAQKLGITNEPVRMDSQCKYACLSRGDGGIYLRLPVRADYEEKIWDHASGSLLVTEAGGVITDTLGSPLDFSAGRTLKRNQGVVASAGPEELHKRIVHVVKEVIYGNDQSRM
ncbi:hypothetical protein BKA69DRAFT_1070308 [Paraphysoderma sedebokerense]|nr:hypothetical protein BKA69DRAFT_1070308 [Paraphysoderma sedebokerense]